MDRHIGIRRALLAAVDADSSTGTVLRCLLHSRYCSLFFDVFGGRVNIGGEGGHDLNHRATRDSQFIFGTSRGRINQFEAILIGRDLQEPPDFVRLLESFWRHVLAPEEQDRSLSLVLVLLDAEAEAAGGLHFAKE